MRIHSLALLAALAGIHPSLALAEHPAPLPVENAAAKTAAEMKPYVELIEHTEAKIEMLPIPGGKFTMGSPDAEPGRKADEGPRHEVTLDPFWMAKCEITWDAYEVWMADLDIARRQILGSAETERDRVAEKYQLTQPTKPYTDMTFGMGKRGYPAICMTQHAARVFCQWLTAKTGRYYRLPTEAEWEYACRAGTTTAYSFGDDPAALGDYAWYYDNSNEKYQKVGQKKPNTWGLHDMHGNVSEWVLDQYTRKFYSTSEGAKNPLAIPLVEYPRVVRGGSWDADAALCRSAARVGSSEDWKQQDPQIPQSIWYFTDALGVGFRIVRPLTEPSDEEKAAKWDKSEPPQIDKDKSKG
ncbi:MAG: formylglycine-generating enzyme family protein [Pirellulaceae bacterium]|nr:formylglycine-generating enzyme family protein [Pirellulaceae bacterium]